ncbi:MAG: alpha/beta hydrolase [Treponema sp.]|jgi:pimeloyl-ACP methyl ester carboxylesterase|nr:alpha/beta hydrolase [Treponema sp.]
MSNIHIFSRADEPMKPWPSLVSSGKLLSLPGGELFFYDYTSAAGWAQKPLLVFIHGLGDEADTWRHILPRFQAAGFRCIALDLPGFGRSLWRGNISVRCHVDAVIRLITESGAASPEHPAVLIGSSMGCTIAELVAVKRSDLVRDLVLLDGCFPVSASVDKSLLMLCLPGIGRNWYRSFRTNHEAAWKSLYAYYHDLDAMSAEDKKFLRERVIARVESINQERGYFSSLRSMIALFMNSGAAFSRSIKQFAGKILLLWGEHDTVMPAEKSAVFCDLRPDAAFRTIAGAGHLPHQEKPAETADEILRFLE